MQMMYHPVASPLLIGLSLPQLCYEKRYIEIPVLIVMPVFYTGLLFGFESVKVREEGFNTYAQQYHDKYRLHKRKDT
jgi:hypothetical protein